MDSNAPSTVDFLIAIYFAVAFVAARFFFDRFIFRRVAIWLLSDGPTPLKINEAVQAKIGKMSESMWKLMYYATVEAFVLSITYHEPWVRDTKECFRGWPNQELKLSLRLFYMCQCGFHIYSNAALLAWETRRKDFAVMMSHHVIPVILIGYSFLTSTGETVLINCEVISRSPSFSLPNGIKGKLIGSIILPLHDASDVLMEAAKVFKYSEKEFRASLCFALFSISWLVLRLIFFPFWVIKASSYHVREVVPLSEFYGCSLYYVFNTMLLTLLVFHIYCWVLIYSMIMKQLKNGGKVGEDIRSDSEDDD